MNTKPMLDLEARRKGIGGSDIAGVLGLEGAFSTAYEVYQDKVHGIRRDLSGDERIYWGHALEDAIAKRYSQLTGAQLVCSGIFKHKKHPFLLGNPDRLILKERHGLEIKNVGEGLKHLWGESGSKDIPKSYFAQINHYMMVLDYERWDLAALFGGQELRTYSFERDLEIDEILIEHGSKFWYDHVQKQIPPEIDYSNTRIQELIKKKYNLVSEKTVRLDDQIEIVDQYEEAKKHIKHYEKIKSESEARILDAMQDAGVAYLADGRHFLRKKIQRKGFTVQPSEYIKLDLKKGA